MAFGVRIPQLDLRPMHTDEAVHAYKFGQLLETGTYHYDPDEYHGPSLYYFSLISAWIGSMDSFAQLTEFSLRIVPLLFGLLSILLLLWLRRISDPWSLMAAAALLTISPAMTFFSRYYIHEMLFLFFTAGLLFAAIRYYKTPGTRWAVSLGIMAAGMVITKETWVIPMAGIGFSALVMWRWHRSAVSDWFSSLGRNNLWKHAGWMFGAALLVFLLFYSSFFTYPRGILEAFSAAGRYLNRAAGGEGVHIHPWYYYLQIVTFVQIGGGPVWTEAVILILALLGLYAAIRDPERLSSPGTVLFIGLTSLVTLAIFSAIPYKTPWNILVPWYGFIFLAGGGAVWLLRKVSVGWRQWLVGLVLVAAGVHLTWQSYQLNFRRYTDPGHPYVYAHSYDDVKRIGERVNQLADSGEQELQVQVIWPGGDYWPLPWYLRRVPGVGWWSNIPSDRPPAPVIIATAELKDRVLRKIYQEPGPGERHLYVPLMRERVYLRPGAEVLGFVRQTLNEQARRETAVNTHAES